MMSRSYLLHIGFENLSNEFMLNFLWGWCGKDQVYSLRHGLAVVRMGCSSGVAPEDTMAELNVKLKNLGCKEIELIAWSLHPDDAIRLGGDE